MLQCHFRQNETQNQFELVMFRFLSHIFQALHENYSLNYRNTNSLYQMRAPTSLRITKFQGIHLLPRNRLLTLLSSYVNQTVDDYDETKMLT